VSGEPVMVSHHEPPTDPERSDAAAQAVPSTPAVPEGERPRVAAAAASGGPARRPFASRVARGLAWNQASKVIEMAAAYAASVLVARALGPVEFGTYSIALSMVTFTYFATSLGLNEVLNVHVPRLAPMPARVAFLLRALLRVRAGIALGLAVALFALAPVLAELFRNPGLAEVLKAAALYVFFYNVTLLIEYFLVGSLQVPRVSRVRIMVQLTNLAAAAAALRWHWHAWMLFLAMAGTSALGLSWLSWGARAALFGAGERFDLAPLRRFGLTLWVTNFVNFFLGRQADILLIGYYRPATGEAGWYSAAAMLAMLCASALLMGAEGVSLAAFSELELRVDRAAIGKLWRLHLKLDMLLSLPLLVFGARFAGEIVGTLYASGFAPAAAMLTGYALVWIATRVIGGGTNMTVLYAMNEPRLPLLIYGVSGLFNLVANLVLVSRLGAIGAVIGTGAAMIGSSIASAAIVMHRTGARVPLGFALKVLAVCGVAALAAGAVPRPGGFLGLAVAAVVGLAATAVGLRLARPLGEEDRRLLGRLNPRIGRLVARL
jgi:O-antigen/teichoic acid export membrane protein